MTPMVVCDTCGKETDKVYRVVVDAGYDRSNAAPCYNCRECYNRKNAERPPAPEPGTPNAE